MELFDLSKYEIKEGLQKIQMVWRHFYSKAEKECEQKHKGK